MDERPLVEALDDDGWIVISGLLSGAEADAINDELAVLVADPPDRRAAGDKPASGTRHLEELDRRSKPIAAVLEHPELLGAVHHLLGPNAVCTQLSWRCPQPGYGSQYLHADDAPRLDHGPTLGATAIVALTEFTEANGATRVVPGSHVRPDLQRRSGSLESHPDEQLLTGAAGTAFVFNAHLLHSGTENRSDAERPALQIVWRRGARHE